MSAWYAGKPEATEFTLFPPAGQIRAWTADKARTEAHLRGLFPGLTFSITDVSLGLQPVIIPILGEAGEGGRGLYAAPPSAKRMRELERALSTVDLALSEAS